MSQPTTTGRGEGRRLAKAALAALGAGATVVGAAAPAHADSWRTHNVQTTLNGGWWLNGRGVARNAGGGLEDWKDFRVGEVRTPAPVFWEQICSYQAAISWQSASGSRVYNTTFSSFHAGCSYATGRFDFDGFTGRYVENTRFPTKFKSNHTPGDNWLAIGTLQD